MSSSHHSIKAVLLPNLLKNNKGKYKSQTITSQTLGVKDICNSCCSKGNTGANPGTMEYHVKLFLEEMGELLTDGFAVNTGYFSAFASLQGSFDTKADKFNADKHKVIFKFTQGNILRKKAMNTKAEILHITTNMYGIEKIIDSHSSSENNLLTPNGALRIKGKRIKLMGAHPDVGIYFIDQQSTARYKVPTPDIVINQNNQLIIVIPQLQPGTYTLVLCTQYVGKSTPIQGLHTNTFAHTLKVE